LPTQHLFATDIDSEAIGWLKKCYKGIADCDVNHHFPPTVYKDGTFDLIYSISIFSHLPEDMQFAWLEELRRIAKPDSYLILTTHGEKHYRQLEGADKNTMLEKGFLHRRIKPLSTEGLPEFYQTSYHSHEYIKKTWSKYFDIIEIRRNGVDNWQDGILLRKRA
jgi:hypothetical protein